MARVHYNHVKGKPEPILNSDVLDVRHDFAQKIGELSAHWNVLELNALTLFMIFLAGDDDLAFEIYYEVLRGESHQRKRALTIATETRNIPQAYLGQIDTFLCDYDQIRKDRNDVIHASWASIPGSDSLFAAQDKNEWLRNNNVVITWNLAVQKGRVDGPIVTGLVIHQFWEYRLVDIQDIINRIKALCARLEGLQKKIAIFCFSRQAEPPWKRAESRLRRLRMVSPRLKNGTAIRLPDRIRDTKGNQ